MITKFLSKEIVPTTEENYHLDEFELFRASYPNGHKHKEDLKKMLVQHNIRIISYYYSQLTLPRMSQLVNADKDFCEEELCTLNNEKVINCRVDRISGVIDFRSI